MMGLEPTTFCMAELAGVRARSRRIAETCRLQRLRFGRANATEPERTLSAAIAAIVIDATFRASGNTPTACRGSASGIAGRSRRGDRRAAPAAGDPHARRVGSFASWAKEFGVIIH